MKKTAHERRGSSDTTSGVVQHCPLAGAQQKSGRDNVLTFFSIARRKSTTEASPAAFLTTLHARRQMPNLRLSRLEIRDVSAYILSLRCSPPAKVRTAHALFQQNGYYDAS